jgi:hypothetical protein
MRHARHLRPQRRLDRWIDNVAGLLALSSVVLSQIHPRIVWWVVPALTVGRIAFSTVYRWRSETWVSTLSGFDDPANHLQGRRLHLFLSCTWRFRHLGDVRSHQPHRTG